MQTLGNFISKQPASFKGGGGDTEEESREREKLKEHVRITKERYIYRVCKFVKLSKMPLGSVAI